ncbi:putative holin-like toxin [Paenibacillus pinihumi]|nr:putative holin-like toxin [Paenibacillus pinihumi]
MTTFESTYLMLVFGSFLLSLLSFIIALLSFVFYVSYKHRPSSA